MNDSWKQRGIVSLWWYTENTRNYPGWHVSADPAGISSLVSLLSAMRSKQELAAYRTIAIAPPSPQLLRIPNNKGGNAGWSAPARWRIRYVENAQDEEGWSFSVTQDAAALSLGPTHMNRLIGGLEGIGRGEDDRCIGDPRELQSRLWFWRWAGQ